MANRDRTGKMRLGDVIIGVNVEGKEVAERDLNDVRKAFEELKATMQRASRGFNFGEYWESAAASIDGVGRALSRFTAALKTDSGIDSAASEFVKSVNAFVAQGGKMEELAERFGATIGDVVRRAGELAPATREAFDVGALKRAYEAMQTLRDNGLDLTEILHSMSEVGSMRELQAQLVATATELDVTKRKFYELRDELDAIHDGEGFASLQKQINDLQWQVSDLEKQIVVTTARARREFEDFLSANDISPDDGRVEDYFEMINSGAMSSKQAIAAVKAEFELALGSIEQFSQEGSSAVSTTRRMSDAMSGMASATDEQSQSMQSLIHEMSELASKGTETSGGINSAAESLAKLIDAIKSLSGSSIESLNSIQSIMFSLSNIGSSIKSTTGDSVKKVADNLKAFDNVNFAKLQSITTLHFDNLNKLSELKVSKAALVNLAENLPKIGNGGAGADVLEKLSKLNFANLKELKVSKPNVDQLRELVSTLNLSQVNQLNGSDLATETTLQKVRAGIEEIRAQFEGIPASIKTAFDFTEPVTQVQALTAAIRELIAYYGSVASAETAATKKVTQEIAEETAVVEQRTEAVERAVQADNAEARAQEERAQAAREAVRAEEEIARASEEAARATEIVSESANADWNGAGKNVEEYAKQIEQLKAMAEELLETINRIKAPAGSTDSGAVSDQAASIVGRLETQYSRINQRINEVRFSHKALSDDMVNGIVDANAALMKEAAKFENLKDTIDEVDDLLDDVWDDIPDEFENIGQSVESVARKMEDATGKVVEEVKEIGESAEYTEKQLSRLLDSLQKSAQGTLKEAVGYAGVNPVGVEKFRTQYDELIALIEECRKKGTSASKEEVEGLNERLFKLKDLIVEMKKRKAEEAEEVRAVKASTAARRESNRTQKESESITQKGISLQKQINQWLEKNPRAARVYGKELKDAMDGFNSSSTKTKAGLDDLSAKFTKVKEEAHKAGLEGETFGQQLQSGWERFGGWTLITRSITMAIRKCREMVTEVREIDKAMTELKKVTDITADGYNRLEGRLASMAREIGAGVSDAINAAADFARLGYDVYDAEELAKAALVYKNVGDGIEDVAQASESIISTIKAFGDETTDAMLIVDKFNEVGKRRLPMPVVTRCLAECYIGQSSIGLCA